MKYSFVLIAYNEENNIEACIDSILAQKQLGTSYEIIVLDDGSRDTTCTIVKELSKSNKRIKLITDGKNHGRGYGRYMGAKRSQGEYVIMVDADIILSKIWLQTCLKQITKYDIVGGIAVPDGDVAYTYRRFALKPKVVMGSTTITGNNGMYRRDVFKRVGFDRNLREGEDVAFNHQAIAAGVSEYCIPGLVVEHLESKSFSTTMIWLYQSGVGATRQLLRFGVVRMPDIAFGVTFFASIGSVVGTTITGSVWWLIMPFMLLLGVSLLHVSSKFQLSVFRLKSVLAILTDSILILCYYIGRLIGFYMYHAKKLVD